MSSFGQPLIDLAAFQRFVLGLILIAGVLVGPETNAGLMAQLGPWLVAADRTVLALFVGELLVRLAAHGSRPWRFFRDPWNVSDFAIVAFCLLPLEAEYSAVLRLVRVLRVLRLITALPRLQILVTALLKSIPSMAYVGVRLAVLFYVYAVVGVSLFGRADPGHFGSLGALALSLFQIVTLDGWADIMRTQLTAGTGTILTVGYFISFILLGTMITLKLLIGVIVTGMEEARQEREDEERRIRLADTGTPSPADDDANLRKPVDTFQQSLTALQRRLR